MTDDHKALVEALRRLTFADSITDHERDDVSDAAAAIESLSAWKAEQLAVEATWDVQAVGKAIGLPLGSNIRAHILPYIESLSEQLAAAQKLVEVQAKDPGLWFVAEYNSEAYLQKALRKLHAAVEGKPI